MSDPSVPSHGKRPLAEAEALPAGARISEFEILHVLGSGGFGIVYLAHDTSLQRRVALKEYLPAALAGRKPDGQIAVRSELFAETFSAGLRSFINESRLLAKFDHPSLVKVHRFWEANGTAYMVMPFYEGVTLKQVRQSMTAPPEEAWLRRVLDALLGALDVMHAASVYHRDIAPDNILLLRSGVPVLLDFGAARHVLAEQTQTITAMLKPAYAPIEQYADALEFRQGPWTDIYATAATLHYCLTGKAPLTAIARTVHESYEPLHQRAELRDPPEGSPYDAQWLAALDWALEVKPQARPQSIAQWKEALNGKVPVPRAVSYTGPIISAAARAMATPEFYATALTPQEYFPTTVAAALRRIPAANTPPPSASHSLSPAPGKSKVSALAAPLAPFATRLQSAAELQPRDDDAPDDDTALRTAAGLMARAGFEDSAWETRASTAAQRAALPTHPDRDPPDDEAQPGKPDAPAVAAAGRERLAPAPVAPVQRARTVLRTGAGWALERTQRIAAHIGPRAQRMAGHVGACTQRMAGHVGPCTRRAVRYVTPFATALARHADRLAGLAGGAAAHMLGAARTYTRWHWAAAGVLAVVMIGGAMSVTAPFWRDDHRAPSLTAEVLPSQPEVFIPGKIADRPADGSSTAPGPGALAFGLAATAPAVTAATRGDASAQEAAADPSARSPDLPAKTDMSPSEPPAVDIQPATPVGEPRQERIATDPSAAAGPAAAAAGAAPTTGRSNGGDGEAAARPTGESAGAAKRTLAGAAKATTRESPSTTPASAERSAAGRSATRTASATKGSTGKPAVSSPRDVCQDRFLLGWFTCMRNACESRRWERHAQCVEWHRMEQEKVLR